ncbi:MAG TPA: phosphoribosylanthranilate isomerase [Polyangiaceae bacterium]|jgi:phosphoribosylanthranilate isomerase
MATWVKICGITRLDDALLALDAGADALGLNFVADSKRRVDRAIATQICDELRDRIELVAVVADQSVQALGELRRELGIDWLQLHGREAPDELELLLPRAFKAISIATADDVALAADYGGTRLLVDAKVPGERGGTGHVFDWSLVSQLSRRRDLIVAGGLSPENVASALAALAPYGVDVASGVELPGKPRQKDEAKLRAFVAAVRAADAVRR